MSVRTNVARIESREDNMKAEKQNAEEAALRMLFDVQQKQEVAVIVQEARRNKRRKKSKKPSAKSEQKVSTKRRSDSSSQASVVDLDTRGRPSSRLSNPKNVTQEPEEEKHAVSE